jgi:predicted Zn-dependent protease
MIKIVSIPIGEADQNTLDSIARALREIYGLEPDRDLFLLRAVKEAIHETGHTCGLGHCTDPRCIMHFSNSLRDTDVKEPGFCIACRNTCGVRKNTILEKCPDRGRQR